MMPFGALKEAAQELSEAYRQGRPGSFKGAANDWLSAYLVTRMPATYGAARAVLEEVGARLGDRPVASVLDIGRAPARVPWRRSSAFRRRASLL